MAQPNLFSERENEVIELLLQGKSNKQIALALGISTSTVEYHLKNVYRKLQVSSRTEAVLRLGKSIGYNTSGELRKSTVEMDGEPADNGGEPISQRRIPMNKMFYIIGGGLLTTALVVVLVLANMPAQNAEVAPTAQADVTPMAVTPIIISSSTPLITGQLPTDWREVTYTNTLDSSEVTLTLKWFYIDSTRVSMEFLVSGFPIPDGYTPIRIIKNVSIHTADGRSIDPDYDNLGGGGGGSGGESDAHVAELTFDEPFLFPIKSDGQILSQAESYIFDVTVGGVPLYSEEGNSTNEILPTTTFHFEARPSYVGLLTFFTHKAANIEDKVVTLKGAEINPTLSVITLCVFSPDKQQWIPSAHLLYGGNIYEYSGFAVTNPKGPLSDEICYRLEYYLPFNLADDPQQSIALWVDKLTKNQPERLPNELISSAFQNLSVEGIEFRYVFESHGARIEILKKPAELTDTEVLTMIRDALTEEANDSGVLIFDLK